MFSGIPYHIGSLLVPIAHAFEIEPPDGAIGGGIDGFLSYVAQIVPVLQGLFVGIAFVILLILAASLVIFSGNESAATETKTGYLHLVIGGILVGAAGLLAEAVTPGLQGVGGEVIYRFHISTTMYNIVLYIKYMLAAALIANIVIQSFRLIVSQGDSAKIERSTKRLVNSFIGVGIVLLVEAIVHSVNLEYQYVDVSGVGAADLNIMNAELVGLANFLLTIIGLGVVVGLIIAGILFILSVNESLKEKAMSVIKTCIVVLIVCLVAYALVNFFLGAVMPVA